MNASLHQSGKRLIVLFLIVAVGILSGMVGGLAWQSAYQDQLSRLTPSGLEEKMTTPTSKSTSPANIAENVAVSMVGIYRLDADASAKAKTAKDKKTVPVSSAMMSGKMLGYGLAATGDGWIVAPTNALLAGSDDMITIIDSDHVRYGIERRVDDTALPVSYLKLSGVGTPLKPFSFTSSFEYEIPMNAYVMSDYATIAPFVVTALGYRSTDNGAELVRSAAAIAKRFNYEQNFDRLGTPVITSQGEILGMTNDHGIIPMQVVREGLDQILRTGKVKRPTLAINYLDNAWMPFAAVDSKGRPWTYGAQVVAGDKLSSPKNTATTVAAITPGDVIVSVNDERVDGKRSLSDIIQQYHIGDTVVLGYQHGDTALTASVVLQ